MRVRAIYIDWHTLVRASLQGVNRANGTIRIRRIEGVPDTAAIVKVWDEPIRQAFGLLIRDASFQDVPEGNPAPEIVGRFADTDVVLTLTAEQLAALNNP